MESKLEQFVAVTGAPRDVAKGFLEACGENLELAINMHIESGGSGSVFPSSTPTTHSPVHGHSSSTKTSSQLLDTADGELLSPASYKILHGVRAPIPQTEGVLIEDELPRNVSRLRRLPQTVFDPFQDYSNITRDFGGPGEMNKKRNLAELFKPPHDLMFVGTFQEAKLMGQHQNKWLIVNIQDSKEFSSQVLNRDVWSDYNVRDLIRQHFIFSQIHRITDDGLKFKQLYHVQSFPYIAVIDPRTGEKMCHWGALSPTEFIAVISEFLSRNPYDLTESTRITDDAVEESEESQLEAAIRASLQDLEKTTADKKAPSKYQLVFSDNSDVDCVSLISSSDNDEPSDMDHDYNSDDVKFLGNSLGSGKSTSTNIDNLGSQSMEYRSSSIGIASQQSGESYNSMSRNLNPYHLKNRKTTVHETDHIPAIRKTKRNRKRYTCRDDELPDELPRKMMRTEISDSSDREEVYASYSSRVQNGEGNGSKEVYPQLLRIQQHSSSSRTNLVDDFKPDELSFILFRLPDGSRLQKPFVKAHPIKELFDFLNSKGFSEDEHEVISQFPRRNLTELDHSTTFEDIQLYPRETVFVHTLE